MQFFFISSVALGLATSAMASPVSEATSLENRQTASGCGYLYENTLLPPIRDSD